MDLMLIKYIGLVVALIILVWVAVEMGRRYYRHKKTSSQLLNTWVPLEPMIHAESDETGSPIDLTKRDQQNSQKRSQQNGHYSESKKKL